MLFEGEFLVAISTMEPVADHANYKQFFMLSGANTNISQFKTIFTDFMSSHVL